MNTILLAVGLISVYFGYKLFCGMSRRVLQTVSGAVLAIGGMVIVAGEAKAFVSHTRLLPVQLRKTPAQQSPAWRNGSAPAPRAHARHEEIV